MIIILDKRHMKRLPAKRDGTTSLARDLGINMSLMYAAEYVVVVNDDTYTVHKDRYSGETNEFPLDELPNVVRDRITSMLKGRDGVSTE